MIGTTDVLNCHKFVTRATNATSGARSPEPSSSFVNEASGKALAALGFAVTPAEPAAGALPFTDPARGVPEPGRT